MVWACVFSLQQEVYPHHYPLQTHHIYNGRDCNILHAMTDSNASSLPEPCSCATKSESSTVKMNKFNCSKQC